MIKPEITYASLQFHVCVFIIRLLGKQRRKKKGETNGGSRSSSTSSSHHHHFFVMPTSPLNCLCHFVIIHTRKLNTPESLFIIFFAYCFAVSAFLTVVVVVAIMVKISSHPKYHCHYSFYCFSSSSFISQTTRCDATRRGSTMKKKRPEHQHHTIYGYRQAGNQLDQCK